MTIEPTPVRIAPWRRRLKRAGIALGVVLTCLAMLCCAGVAYLLYTGQRAPREERAMEAFAHDLCQHLVGGKADAVHAALSAEARDLHSAQELAEALAARHLSHCEVMHAVYLFLLVAYVEIQDDRGLHTFDLIAEAGEWKVDSDILHDLDSPPSHGGGGGFGD